VYENTTFLWALTGIIDERGVRLSTYGYDSAGRSNLTQHTGPDSQFTLAFTDGPTSASTTAVDGFGTSLSFGFTKIGGAMKKTSDNNYVLGNEARTYDTNGNPLTLTNRRGYQTTFVYDASRNLETSRTEASGQSVARTIATTWNSTYRLPATITEPSGVAGVNLVTTLTYDASGNLTKKNLTAGAKVREWNYTVNARGQVLTINGPRTDASDVTTMTYYGDADTCTGCRGQVHTVTNALSQVTTFTAYDADGRPTTITDPNGVATTLTYKPRGWLASRSTAGETTSYDYDFMGNLTKVTLPDSSWVIYQYDAASALIGMDDSLGNSLDYELDVMGNRVSETIFDPNELLRKTKQRAYDAANRLQQDIGGMGQVTQYGYDANKNLTTITDPLNHVTTTRTTPRSAHQCGRMPRAANTVFTYDAKDRLRR
jgi:YD repeat-containing protein